MRFDIATLFPEMCETVVNSSIIGRGIKAGKLEVHCHQIRDYTTDKHRRTDLRLHGGGMGMLMTCQPIHDCWKAVSEQIGQKPYVIYLSPQGKVLTQAHARELKEKENLFLLCGHYEGVDQRVLDEIVDEELSIGDYVLTGGELGALVLVDCIGPDGGGCTAQRGVLYRGEPLERTAGISAVYPPGGMEREKDPGYPTERRPWQNCQMAA